MLRARLLRPDQPPLDVDRIDWQGSSRREGSILWIDGEMPSPEDLHALATTFALDPAVLEIVQRRNRRPVVRVFRDMFVVTALAIDVHEERASPRITVVEIDSIIGESYLVSLHRRPHPPPLISSLEERITNPYLGRLHGAYLLYVLLDTMVGQYTREFDEVEDKVERLEEQMLRAPGRTALDQALLMKRHILALRRLVAPHREAFGILLGADVPLIQQNDVDVYFRDLVLHLDEFIDRLDHARDVLAGAYDLYISNMSHRTNQELRVLTFLSAVLLPMTVVTGIFGTNFAIAEYLGWQPFYLMLGGMAIMALGMLAFFRWRHWL